MVISPVSKFILCQIIKLSLVNNSPVTIGTFKNLMFVFGLSLRKHDGSHGMLDVYAVQTFSGRLEFK